MVVYSILFAYALLLFGTCSSSKSAPRGVYLHIPFCMRRCFYCNFPIKVIGDRSSSQKSETESYVEVLKREIDAASSDFSFKDSTKLETIYFGGGTPSLLSPDLINALINHLETNFGIEKTAEITLEMDPGTFDLEKLIEYKNAGINRISMGVQSFDQEVLSSCGRAHSAVDVEIAITNLHLAGIDNFSIDLISSLPGVTLEMWLKTLEKAVESKCNHISVYDLQIEDKTAFGRWYKPGEFPLPNTYRTLTQHRKLVFARKRKDFSIFIRKS